MIITGDDILIEYVNRIITLMGSIMENYHGKFTEKSDKIDKVEIIIPQSIRQTLEQFIAHKIWSNKMNKIDPTKRMVDLIKMRHGEMVERRTKILKSQLKKQNIGMPIYDIMEQLKN